MNPSTSTQQDSGKFGSKPNYLSAMLSISLILFILGIFGFILINTRQLISFYKENLNLIIENQKKTQIYNVLVQPVQTLVKPEFF